MTFKQRKLLRFVVEILCLAAAFAMSFMVRIDVILSWAWGKRILLHIVPVVLLELACLWLLGALRGAWRFVSIHDVKRILLGLIVSCVPLILVRIVLGCVLPPKDPRMILMLPWGVIFVNLCLAFLALVGVRVFHRLFYEARIRRQLSAGSPLKAQLSAKTFLIGEDRARSIIESIRMHPELAIDVIGVISHGESIVGDTIADVKIVGKIRDIPECAKKYDVTNAIICENPGGGHELREILELCSVASLSTRIIPQFDDLVEGKFDVGHLREVRVEDLLHREPVQLDKTQVSAFLRGKRVLVSGAGGSIGSEICRQILAFEPRMIVLLERCELFIYEIEKELSAIAGQTQIVPRLVDICDIPRVEAVFEETRPEVVFHAAAYKHVPMLEYNPGEAIRNNIEGTMNMVNIADASGCEAFVMISTDKAVNPTSIMGTSKRIAELYLQVVSKTSKTRFCAVRFGNVLGSTGSVVPLFRSQLEKGGPLTVTHPDMVRYFMTIPEASQLVMQAGAMGKGGEIFVLNMGEPVRIVDLARDLIRLSGKSEKEVPIVFTGTRPGEKLFEELGFDEECMDRTGHPKIYVGKLRPVERDRILEGIEKLRPLRDSQDNAAVRRVMSELVPEMMTPES